MLATTQSIKPEPPWHLTPSPFNYSPLIFKQNRGKKFSPGKRQHKLFNVRSLSVWLSQFLSRYSISSPFTFSHRDFYSCTSLSPFFFLFSSSSLILLAWFPILCRLRLQLWFYKETTTDRSSQMSILRESQCAHLHPSMSPFTVGEPPPASWHHSGSYKWMWHSCSFSHSPLPLLACLPGRNVLWNTVGISHSHCCEHLLLIFNLEHFRDLRFYLCLGYLCCGPCIWGFISSKGATGIAPFLDVTENLDSVCVG